MTAIPDWTAREAFLNRFYARRAGRGRKVPSFAAFPEPATMGEADRGRQILDGKFVLDGRLVEVLGASIWQNKLYGAALQECDWLNDLAALGDQKARARAQAWVWDWIARFGRGEGWTPQSTARRLMNWLHHAEFLLQGMQGPAQRNFMQSLARQTIYLARAWQFVPVGQGRVSTLAGLNAALLALDGLSRLRPKAEAAFLRALSDVVGREGQIASRNPAEAAVLFCDIVGVAVRLHATGQAMPPALQNVIEVMAPLLRGLRHGDGTLARLQGSNGGNPVALDAALAQAGVRAPAGARLHMGFARISAGRLVLIADAAPAPAGGHASATAIEISVGRRLLVTSCGDGSPFGTDWRQAGRGAASHSTLVLEGGAKPAEVMYARTPMDGGTRLELGHDGWRAAHGLVHARQIDVDIAGRVVMAEEMLMTIDAADQARFDRALVLSGGRGVDFALRFHLHPDVTVVPQDDPLVLNLVLKSGEVWALSHDGQARMTVEPSVYVENGVASPRSTQQVVLMGRAMSYATRMRWALGRATG